MIRVKGRIQQDADRPWGQMPRIGSILDTNVREELIEVEAELTSVFRAPADRE